MKRIILKNKPLIEAIFEVRWQVGDYDMSQLEMPDVSTFDPNYKLNLGILYSKLKNYYPDYEPLPGANIPDEISAYVVQHRFKTKDSTWPLIQIGPGILTLNSTEDYVWDDFQERIQKLITAFFQIYSNVPDLKINNLSLRYIDGIDFDFSNNAFEFIKDQMKINISMYDKLFEDENIVENIPHTFNLNFAYRLKKPQGNIITKFASGKHKNQDTLIWETVINSENNEVQTSEEFILEWVDKAHEIADDWFFKIIDGELKEKFK